MSDSLTFADILRAMADLDEPIASSGHVGSDDVTAWIRSRASVRSHEATPFERLTGIPIILDETLPANVFEIRDQHAGVMLRATITDDGLVYLEKRP